MDAAKRAACALTLAAFALSWAAPAWPVEQALHSSLPLVALAALWWVDRRWPLRARHVAAAATLGAQVARPCRAPVRMQTVASPAR